MSEPRFFNGLSHFEKEENRLKMDRATEGFRHQELVKMWI